MMSPKFLDLRMIWLSWRKIPEDRKSKLEKKISRVQSISVNGRKRGGADNIENGNIKNANIKKMVTSKMKTTKK
jgi:hypothetical protein